MKIKKIISLIIFIITIFTLISPAYAILAGNRDIIIEVSNVEDVENTEIYVLYPVDYIEYLYTERLKDVEDFYKNTHKENIVKKMQKALKEKDFINLIIMDELGILEVGISEKYVEYEGKSYIKADIYPTYLEKSSMESLMQSIGKEYDENTICVPLFVDYDYTGTDFKFLLEKENNKKILALDNFKYKTSYRGVTDYTLVASVDYNEMENFVDEDENLTDMKEVVFEIEKEKSLKDIIEENTLIIVIIVSVINLLLIIVLTLVLVKIKK